jgi:hypothetical protein
MVNFVLNNNIQFVRIVFILIYFFKKIAILILQYSLNKMQIGLN